MNRGKSDRPLKYQLQLISNGEVIQRDFFEINPLGILMQVIDDGLESLTNDMPPWADSWKLLVFNPGMRGWETVHTPESFMAHR